jgi:flavin-dependent dehydrogenase
MSVERCDVAIIGGGIAGLSLGKFLAQRGIPFILFEEHRNFFQKACGEGIIRYTVGHEFYDLYESSAGVEKEVAETVIHTACGSIVVEMPVLMTDKRAVEREFARQAAAGGEIRMGEKVATIRNGVLLPQEVRPHVIVGADGCFSTVRKYLGLRAVRYGIAAEGHSTDVDFDRDRCHVVMRKDVVRHGYAWYFPKKDGWNIGIGSCNRRGFKSAFRTFRQHNPARGWRGAPIPIDIPTKTYGRNALVVGDAAAHVLGNVGEGIMLSIIAAKIAADVIENAARSNFSNPDLATYEKRWRTVLWKQLVSSYLGGMLFFKAVATEQLRHVLLARMCQKTSAYYRNLPRRWERLTRGL